MIPSQMLKGTLEGCVLAVISKKETYGYEISEQLMKYGFGKISTDNMPNSMSNIEKNDLICATYKESEVGPRRKYYELTSKGNDTLKQFFSSFCELENAVNCLMKDIQGGFQNE